MRTLSLFVAVVFVAALALGLSGCHMSEITVPPPPDARADGSPWGFATSAEWSGEYPRFEPLMHQAGAIWFRHFPTWETLQPKPDEWNWKPADELVSISRSNGIRVTGLLFYFAPWASSGGDGRTFPIRDMQFWRDYVTGVVSRYRNDIKYWEVWNEPQSFQKNGTPRLYADMVREAFNAAKKADPGAKLGLTTANFAVAYLNEVLKAGATNHFDYLCVHPYENVEVLKEPDGEIQFLSLADNLRRLLAAHRQRPDLPLWITEIGFQAPIKPDADKDALQAELLVKTYVLGLAQGFERVFWFEARGPAYGHETDHGLIRRDWSLRPAYTALKTMTALLGQSPRYLGWLDLDGSYGFAFQNALVAWSPVGKQQDMKFDVPVRLIQLDGSESERAAGQSFTLSNTPVFILGAPSKHAQRGPFPWGGDFSRCEEQICFSGQRRLDKGQSAAFRVHPSFAGFGTTNLAITVVARRLDPAKTAGMQLFYETLKTLHGYDRAGWWTIPADDRWHEHTWRLNDANFVGTWGYHFALTEASGSFLIKEIRVKRERHP